MSVLFFPRVFIISNECLSETGSNGRTLYNFVSCFPKDNTAQFFISKEKIDLKICKNYFNVTDEEALNSFFSRKTNRKASDRRNDNSLRRVNKNPLTSLVRDIVWSSHKWGFDKLLKWVESFNPDVILFQAGDSAFLCKLALQISDKLGLPIVIYNSENYFFKNYDYFRSKGINHIFYPIYHARFKHSFSKLIKRAASSIYISDYLKEVYDKRFGLPSHTIYTATSIEPRKEPKNQFNRPPVISYFGNIGVGRYKKLIEFASILQKIDKKLVLNVYTKFPNESIEKEISATPGILYRGFVSYELLKKNMEISDILVHVESSDDYYEKDLNQAFSTKIADCLSLGNSFVFFGPASIACSKYLVDNNAAYVATTSKELEEVLRKITTNPFNIHFDDAKRLVERNHSLLNNQKTFMAVINEAINK